MSGLKSSYKLSELPDNVMLSPKYLFEWWDGVIDIFGSEVAINNKSPDFKLARELWVAAVFACCKRLSTGKEHWVSAVSDEAPDAFVAFFDVDHIGANRQIYQIEVTEYDDHADSLEQIIKKKMDKAYSPTTRIVCYMTKQEVNFDINLPELVSFIKKNNPRDYEIWLLGGFTPERDKAAIPQKLLCLTSGEDYQIDLAEEKLVPNIGEAIYVPVAKSVNKDGEFDLIGKITLEFPASV